MAINDIHAYSTVAASNTDIASANIAEGCAPSGINNALRSLTAQLRLAVANKGSDKAAATTTSIAETGTSVYAKITGTTTITSFGTPDGNPVRWIQWSAATPVTHNATSMILLGGASKTYAAGDISAFIHEGSGNWRELVHEKADGKPVTPSSNGVHKLWIPASALTPAATNGPAAGSFVGGTVAQNFFTYDFDQSTNESAFVSIGMPSSWDEGTVTYRAVWTAASGTGDVVWILDGTAYSDDDALDAAFGTGAGSPDTLLATGDLHRSPESSAITIAGTPAANDLVNFRIRRNANNVSDTLNADAKLIGIELYITINAAVDVA